MKVKGGSVRKDNTDDYIKAAVKKENLLSTRVKGNNEGNGR